MKLERISPPLKSENGMEERSWNKEANEEEELRNWADLREFQERFARSGGFLEI